MNRGDHRPGDHLDDWLISQRAALLADVIRCMDVDTGLREILIASHHAALLDVITDELDTENGLATILATFGPTVPGTAAEPSNANSMPHEGVQAPHIRLLDRRTRASHRTRLSIRLNSSWLISLAACLIAAVVIGVITRSAPGNTGGGGSTLSTGTSIDDSELGATYTPDHTPTPVTAGALPTGRNPPAGYQWVQGPAGLQTVAPLGWLTEPKVGPGASQRTDPTHPDRYVKFGASRAPSGLNIQDSYMRYENSFGTNTSGYRRITLAAATYGDHEAVEWEFEQKIQGQLVHKRSLYWRANGNEYFVLASGPTAEWNSMRPIYNAMVANSSP
jgi:hypothetical protein